MLRIFDDKEQRPTQANSGKEKGWLVILARSFQESKGKKHNTAGPHGNPKSEAADSQGIHVVSLSGPFSLCISPSFSLCSSVSSALFCF